MKMDDNGSPGAALLTLDLKIFLPSISYPLLAFSYILNFSLQLFNIEYRNSNKKDHYQSGFNFYLLFQDISFWLDEWYYNAGELH